METEGDIHASLLDPLREGAELEEERDEEGGGAGEQRRRQERHAGAPRYRTAAAPSARAGGEADSL